MNSPHKGGMAILMAMGKPKGGDEMPEGEPGDNPDDDETPMGSGDAGSAQPESEQGYSIKMPEGYQPPDGTEPGQGFDATVRAHIDDDGMLCIDSVDGIPTHKGGDAGAEETESADESSDGGQPEEEQANQANPQPVPKSGMEPDAGKAMEMAAKKMSNSKRRF